MNAWLRALLYTLAFLLLFVWMGLGLFDAERAKDPIANWLSRQTGEPVAIGRLVFNPLHPYTLLAEQVSYGEAVKFDKVYIEVNSIDWLSRDVRLAHLDLIKPSIRWPLPNQLPSLPLRSLTVQDSKIDGLNLISDGLKLQGASATLSNWQLLSPGQPVLADLSLNINRLETPKLTLTRLALAGKLQGQVLTTDRLVTQLFDGVAEAGVVLDWPARSLRLQDLKARRLRIELADLGDQPWPLRRVSLDRGDFQHVSLNSLEGEFSLNDFNGELNQFEWQRGSAASGQLLGSLGDAGRGLFQLEDIEGQLSFSGQQINATLKGKGYDGSFDAMFSLDPDRQQLRLRQLSLTGMDISLPQGWWQAWQAARPARLEISQLHFDKLRVLSFDEALPLSLSGWNLDLQQLGLDGRQPLALSEQGLLNSDWIELAWDGLSARNGQLALSAAPGLWQLSKLSSQLPDEGSLAVNGQWSREAQLPSSLTLKGEKLDLAQWGKLLHSPLSFAGKADLAMDLQASLPEWRTSLSGTLSLDAKDPFWDGVKLDPLLDEWFAQATPPGLSQDALWQAMQGGDTPFYQLALAATIQGGKLQLTRGGASTITHLLALSGGLDLGGDLWQLDIGALNREGCAELIGQWRGPLAAPELAWQFSAAKASCDWQVGVSYPAQGRDTPLHRPPTPDSPSAANSGG
ncbi:membrane assembly protein AsmA [Aeromonas sp. BIGb0445]|uniref:membrane assembly protein AsmA n=1 Tax=Aeromonas sp. BIGb0445 TaxID=2940593 RepID=UPI00216A6135|nr:membrane assembly protein AsmA [Aeromonas sp. BIGb0445]MCS3460776.1 hypothetical protein [Aeromonas sp. BIGb0445]